MLVAISCYAGNYELAKHTLAHSISLNERVGYDFLLVHSEGMDVSELKGMLAGYARSVKLVPYEPADGWPLGKNFAWQAAARYVFEKRQGDSWLWWEPDAIPLKKDWLDLIATEHQGKQVMVCLNNSGYFDGVGVYPGNVLGLSMGAMMCRAAPFDQVAAKELMPFISNSKTISSVWDVNGLPATFKSKQDVWRLCGDAALFHRCKDGSLVSVLNETVIGRAIAGLKQVFAPVSQKNKTCVVMLGRYGDIVNVLPVCRELAQRDGVKPGLMVADQFKDLLDGVSYVEPEIFAGSFTDTKEAVKLAQSRYDKVLVGQVNSRNVGVNTECSSFTEESWRQMGFLDDYGKLPLIFDRRDYQREALLVKSHRKTEKPLLLVNTAGKSSPLPCAKDLLAHLYSKWGERYEILDLGGVKAERVYDLIGLMDVAACLISIDTATLHLSATSHVPLIALLAEKPTLWHGSRPKPATMLARRYSEVMERLPEIDSTLGRLCVSNGTLPKFTSQTEWPCGQFNLALNKDVAHFNPGLVRDGRGQLWLLARKSVRGSDRKLNSRLLACKLNERMEAVSAQELTMPKCRFQQHEDPRVIWSNNRFYVMFCGWGRKPKMMPKQVMAIFDENWKSEGIYQAQFGNNFSGSPGCEKNWALFGHDSNFHFIYSFKPHLVIQIVGELELREHLTEPKVSWNYGEIRGGTPPVRVGSEYITFFHSSQPWRNGQRRYYMGAYAFESKSPFRVTRITKEPLLVGSENDTRIHGGPPVIFPCGALLENGEWIVTFGVNDEACGWIKIPMKDLEARLCT